ncbi:MAG: ROK family protein [Anaeromassilibacillus sp.]
MDEHFVIVASKAETALPRPCDAIVEEHGGRLEGSNGTSRDFVEGIGVCRFGVPRYDRLPSRVVVYSIIWSLPRAVGEKLSQQLEGLPVWMANDADAAAFGEFKAGAGRGSEHMIAITLGTGLGSGIIIHSKLYTGFAYGGAEFGHSLLVKDGELCTCGRRGCLEAYASATGLIRMTKRHMESNRDSMMWKLVDGDLNRVSGRTAFDAMRQGDAEGSRVVEIYTECLAEGIVNIVNIFQPEIICIGGGLSKEGDTLLKPINRYIEQYAFSRFADKNTVVRIAELGNDAGLIGQRSSRTRSIAGSKNTNRTKIPSFRACFQKDGIFYGKIFEDVHL